MTALREKESRQSGGYYPTAQSPARQETDEVFGGDPFPLPGSCRGTEGTDGNRASIMLCSVG